MPRSTPSASANDPHGAKPCHRTVAQVLRAVHYELPMQISTPVFPLDSLCSSDNVCAYPPSPAIVHRDLSSRNVLYDGRTAKLADLGQAKAMGVAVAAAGSRQTAMPGAMVCASLTYFIQATDHSPESWGKTRRVRKGLIFVGSVTCVA